METAAVTPALVAGLVADQFPQWADLPVRPVEPHGWDNASFRLGGDMSVRLPSADQYALQVDKEHRWLPVLAPYLPLEIPQPLAKGAPGRGYPWQWSIYRWLEGDPATAQRIADGAEFATDLADFLAALYKVDPAGGPPPGKHNFFRGGPLVTYDAETRNAIATLGDDIDTDAATELWEVALDSAWRGPAVWLHGDVTAANLLVTHGRLSAVIDFGCSAVGDTACDTTIAWTFFSGHSREAFRARLPVDDATWMRGRGWALWKALVTLVDAVNSGSEEASKARQVIEEVLSEHKTVA